MSLNSQELWSLNVEDFNKWRQENDLPSLLQFFKGELLNFCDWMSEQGLTDEAFLKAPHTGEWFLGNNVRQFVSYFEDDKPRFVISDQFDPHYFSIARQENARTLLFRPYLAWGAERHGRTDFIPIDKGRSNNSDSVIFGMWRENGNSHAYLLKQFRVLKLAAILGKGTVAVDVRTISKQVAAMIREYKEALTLNHLLEVRGMGLAKAGQILSAFELARRHLVKDA
jgi:hypothetical protein